MEETLESDDTQEPPSTSRTNNKVLARYFDENDEETLDYEIEHWDVGTEDDEEDGKRVSEEEDDGGFVLESGKSDFKLIRDDYKRKLNLQDKPKVVYRKTSMGFFKPGPLWKFWNYQHKLQKKSVAKHRTTFRDNLLGFIWPKVKSEGYYRRKKKNAGMAKDFIVIQNYECGKSQELRFTFHQWHHFAVPFGPEVFAPPIRSVEEILDDNSVKSCDGLTDASNDEERTVRDLRISLVEVTSDGILERLFDGFCLTDFMFNKCKDKDCFYKYKHYLGEDFEKRLIALNFDSLKIAYKFMKKCYVFRLTYKSFIRAMVRLQERHFMAKNMVGDMLHQFAIEHVVGIRQVILGLVTSGLQFHEAVHLVIQENDITDMDLNDSLLRIIILHYNLSQNWFLVHILLEKRDKVPQNIAQNLIEICIMQPVPDVELARNVMKDLVQRNLIDMREIHSSYYSELLMQATDEHGNTPRLDSAAVVPSQ